MHRIRFRSLPPVCTALAVILAAAGSPNEARSSDDTILIEAESFASPGGWKLDTQFIETMGSPYLLAHGLGQPVEDAATSFAIPEGGEYRVFVRTMNWVARLGRPGEPGRFRVSVNGEPLPVEFGTEGAEWHWQSGGTVTLAAGSATIALHDQTGFDGRCDAVLITRDPDFVPDNTSEILPAWRRRLAGQPAEPEDAGSFDLVIVGGGYAGSCAAISAARMGCRVALIQNRGVLGGNGSSEVRVWAKGNTPPGLYPVGDIVNEFADSATKSPGAAEEFEDAKKLAIVSGEPNIELFLHHHFYSVEMDDDAGAPPRIRAVRALDVRTNAVRRFVAPLFADCTGHGYLAMKAGAELNMEPGGRMGMSNMWTWENTDAPAPFPATAWALDLAEEDFPYPKRFHAEWFWESGYDKHPLRDLEAIRDWNLLAAYGAWNAIKNKGAFAEFDPAGLGHANARMTWLAYVGGTRETQQIMGDILLTEEDIVNRKPFPDGCVLTTWSIDLHYPKQQYAKNFSENPFIAVAVHGEGVDRKTGYPIPYRCFYSRNIDNLFMAGRNVSVTHEALGTVRVMKTCGMMGVVVGKAASLAVAEKTNPRGVYQSHLDALIGLMKLPGAARRPTVDAPIVIPEGAEIPVTAGDGLDPARLPGVVVDNAAADVRGTWTAGDGVKGFVGVDYLYAPCSESGGEASVVFSAAPNVDGRHELRLAYRPHENRSAGVEVIIDAGGARHVRVIDQTKAPDRDHGFVSLGVFELAVGRPVGVTVTTTGRPGFAVADAIQLLPLVP